MTYIRSIPHPITPAAIEFADRMRATYCRVIEATGTELYPEQVDHPFFDPEWHQRQIDYHPKWMAGRIPETVERIVSNVAHCSALKGYCAGCDNPRFFGDGIPYCSREFFKDHNLAPLPCPKTLADLKDSLVCQVNTSLAVNVAEEEA